MSPMHPPDSCHSRRLHTPAGAPASGILRQRRRGGSLSGNHLLPFRHIVGAEVRILRESKYHPVEIFLRSLVDLRGKCEI